MPSPGVPALKTALAAESFLIAGKTVNFDEEGDTIVKLAEAMDAGWTSSSPATGTVMAAQFALKFSGYASGDGLSFLNCIAVAIDTEVAAWIASYDVNTSTHLYAVNAATIKASIIACSPISSVGVTAMATAAADAFLSGFDQAAG